MHFENELNLLKTQYFREQTEKVLRCVPDSFFVTAASSSGKYHPSYAIGERGLYKHSIAVVHIAVELMKLDFFMYPPHMTDHEHDSVIAACMLHDICKYGVNGEEEFTVFSHPILASQLVRDICEPDYASYVAPLIASHMGQWNMKRGAMTMLPKPLTPLQYLVHMADYIASRRFLEVDFDRF